ncbi:DUF2567 domain-containing protein [Streptomyces sp. RB6PN25]|uniref:DUF2567 domain-containing protein n=1 Tax=Streptomyces humicola TaxID=2953240 RepID=A0ABT1PV03_9ACTN|nr:DUF2567 domain-containing protein [Streptomyces humicola]MCQ4081497.1 DUF2567 domain-containing protein [Streptomyces humicola]
MTAPLTPHDQQPPHPPVPSGGVGSPDERPDVGREVRDGALIALGVAVLGVVLAVVWWWAAPQVPLISDGTAVYLKDSEGEQSVGADGWFTLMGLGFGALSAGAVFWWRRAGGVAVVIGLAVGAVAASLIAWRIGILLGPTQNVVAHAKLVGAGKVFYAPLQLRAKAALLAWPIAATGVFLALTSAFGPRDEQRDGEHAPTRWDGWSTPPAPSSSSPASPAPGEQPPREG